MATLLSIVWPLLFSQNRIVLRHDREECREEGREEGKGGRGGASK
jgi:hypothetical protein